MIAAVQRGNSPDGWSRFNLGVGHLRDLVRRRPGAGDSRDSPQERHTVRRNISIAGFVLTNKIALVLRKNVRLVVPKQAKHSDKNDA